MAANDPRQVAERALAAMKKRGFDAAQASASSSRVSELNVNHNEPSLMRSVDMNRLALVGLVDTRRATTELSDLSAEAVEAGVARLYAEAVSAPQDDANGLSSEQSARIVQGPLEAHPGVLLDKVVELLALRERETPQLVIEEALASHTLLESQTFTSGGSDLSCRIGWYEMTAMGTARDGQAASSFNFAGGLSNDLASRHAGEWFGIGPMMRDTVRQTHPRALDGNFVGDVVLTPTAVEDLLGWLQSQLSDVHLISGSSLYLKKVGERIASPLLGLKSRFDAPGVAAISGDAFATPPVTLLEGGVLRCLTPSYYGSRKTGVPHVPVAGAGWEIEAGETPLAGVIEGVSRGALVGRLSMGNPASNGDFSGVIKNSFLIEDGRTGPALAEVMISGNMAQMLRDVVAVSAERLDAGVTLLPWLRIGGLHFS